MRDGAIDVAAPIVPVVEPDPLPEPLTPTNDAQTLSNILEAVRPTPTECCCGQPMPPQPSRPHVTWRTVVSIEMAIDAIAHSLGSERLPAPVRVPADVHSCA